MGLLYGRARRLTAESGGFRPGQILASGGAAAASLVRTVPGANHDTLFGALDLAELCAWLRTIAADGQSPPPPPPPVEEMHTEELR
jgi:hypothetical protein